MKIIGLDFDNTLTNYDSLFYQTAIDLNLIPQNIKSEKLAIRNYLKSKNKEDEFTLLQGKVYGERIAEAEQSKGMYKALMELKQKGNIIKIVSHKTKYPIKGERYDLHKGALEWLSKNKFFNNNGLNIKRNDIFFESTKELKIERILKERCDVFIDDLPEILNLIDKSIERILYSPKNHHINYDFKKMNKWSDLSSLLK